VSASIKDDPFFENCYEKLKLKCKEVFEEKARESEADMESDYMRDLYYRILMEMDTIKKNGFCQEIYLFKTIVDYARSKKCSVDICGDIETSFVAYLLGLVDDPQYYYFPSRYPYMYILASEEFKKELTGYFKVIFGEDKVTYKNDYLIFGNKENIKDHRTPDTIWIHII